MSGIIYCITNKINGKKYVGYSASNRRGGKAEDKLNNRWSEHKSDAFNKKKERPFYIEIREYGEHNFVKGVLEFLNYEVNINILLEREAFWIKQLDTTNPDKGYNLSAYASGNFKRTEKHLKQMSECKMGHFVSQETKDKIGHANRGRVQTQEEKDRRTQSLKAEFERKKKPLRVIETNEIYKSLTDCAILKFEDKEVATNISAVIKGRRKSYKGFTFEYLS